MKRAAFKSRVFLSTSAILILVGGIVLAQNLQIPTRPIRPSNSLDLIRPAERLNPSAVKIARLHYSGGGDWYLGRSGLPNVLSYLNEQTCFRVDTLEHEVKLTDANLFEYPFLFATGHGVMSFNDEEAGRLREYLTRGGFLFVNDSYGMAETFLDEMAALFPEREVVELPFDHPLYHSYYDFPGGPPKIHQHDGKPPRGYAIIVDGRVVMYFLVEADIGDGWEDPQVHNDPPEKRELAFKMGVNIIAYSLLN